MEAIYLSIEPEKTGKKIKKLLDASGYTVRDVQRLMGFNNPQAITSGFRESRCRASITS